MGNENFFDGYKEGMDKLKNHPEFLKIDTLIYEVFNTKSGKMLLEEFDKRYLMPALVRPGAENYHTLITFYEGFKEAIRFIKNCMLSTEQRMKAEKTE